MIIAIGESTILVPMDEFFFGSPAGPPVENFGVRYELVAAPPARTVTPTCTRMFGRAKSDL